MNTPKVEQVVVHHDSRGNPHKALVTAVWSEHCINVVLVNPDEDSTDTYGRQIMRETSVQHASLAGVHGNYWRFEDEAPIEYKPPLET
jgi:hypothetical protein